MTEKKDSSCHALRGALVHAVTVYDRRRAGRKGYNRYALAQYLDAAERAATEVDKGFPVRAALCRAFNDRLLDACLAAVGEPPAS